MTPTTRGLGVTMKSSGMRSERISTLGDVMEKSHATSMEGLSNIPKIEHSMTIYVIYVEIIGIFQRTSKKRKKL